MMRPAGVAMLAALALAAIGLAGCARRDRLVLFSNEGGAATGAVAVLDPVTGSDVRVVDRANDRAKLSGRNVAVSAQPAAVLDKRYGALLASLPEAPRSFVLYFKEGTTDLIPASEAQLPGLFAEIGRRPGADVQIIGHTDTVGADADNDALSKRRADEMAQLLQKRGLDVAIVMTVGRGERDLERRTGDNVREQRNRRVEVVVR